MSIDPINDHFYKKVPYDVTQPANKEDETVVSRIHYLISSICHNPFGTNYNLMTNNFPKNPGTFCLYTDTALSFLLTRITYNNNAATFFVTDISGATPSKCQLSVVSYHGVDNRCTHYVNSLVADSMELIQVQTMIVVMARMLSHKQ